ncbi:MAG: hypothetical protein R2704_03245 [Microthrixaceae bacterium]
MSGAPGLATWSMPSRLWAEELLDLLGPPEATVIHIGGNDLFRPGNPPSFGRGLRSLGGWLGSSDTGEATVLGLIPCTALGLTAAEANWRLRRTVRAAAPPPPMSTPTPGARWGHGWLPTCSTPTSAYAAWAWGFADAPATGAPTDLRRTTAARTDPVAPPSDFELIRAVGRTPRR